METRLLEADIIGQIQEVFAGLQEPVEVLFFGKQDDCDYCAETQQLISEVSDLSDLIHVSAYDLDSDVALAQQYKIDKAPALVIAGRNGDQILDYGIRLFGMPAGHEFSTLIHDLVLVSSRDSGLRPKTRELLQGLKEPVHLMVFVTPTCPYCPRAVVLAHQLAMESPLIEAEMVEASEFPELADRFRVSGVPQTTLNLGAGTVVGAVAEENLLAEILQLQKA